MKQFLAFVFALSACTTSIVKKTSYEPQPKDILSLPRLPVPDAAATPAKKISFLWPVEGTPRVASFFGWRKKGRRKRSGERMHEGVDLGGKMGQHIFASADGHVVDLAYVHGYGRTVVLYHGGGWSTLYAHLSKYRVRKGQEVKAGDLIALMGRSGHAEGVHVHFEVRKGADPLDPLLFLPSRELQRYAPHEFYPTEDL